MSLFASFCGQGNLHFVNDLWELDKVTQIHQRGWLPAKRVLGIFNPLTGHPAVSACSMYRFNFTNHAISTCSHFLCLLILLSRDFCVGGMIFFLRISLDGEILVLLFILILILVLTLVLLLVLVVCTSGRSGKSRYEIAPPFSQIFEIDWHQKKILSILICS